MRILSRRALLEFSRQHPDAYEELEQWFRNVKRARWQNFVDLRGTYADADVVGERTVFNIRGNRYRLIARVNYRKQTLFILHVLTHKEYDRGKWK